MLYRHRVSISAITREANGSQIPKQLQVPTPAPPPPPPPQQQQLTFLTRRWSSSSSLLSIPPSKCTQYLDGHFIHCRSPCYAAPTLIDWNRNLFHGNLYSRLKSPPHDLSQLRRLHALLVVGGFFHSADTALGSHLVHAYVKFRSLDEALLVFHHQLPQKKKKKKKKGKNVIIAWNAILRGYVNTGQFAEAIELYQLMLTQSSPLVPDNFTYPLVLKACAGMSALEIGREVVETIRLDTNQPNMHVECAAVDMFAKCGSLDEARVLFEDMTTRDLASWTAIICGTIRNGEWLESLHLFRRMRSEQGIRLDSAIVAAFLPVCCRLEEGGRLGMTLQGCTIRSGFDTDLYVSNALVDMYCKCGDAHEAYRVFSNMVHKDAVSWSTLISGYAQNCLYCRSIELYLEMKSSGVRTTAVTAASVLPGFGRLKKLKQGKELHNYILKQGYALDIVFASALVDMYANCGAKRKAEQILEIMFDKDITLWNSMIVGHASDEDFDSAFRIFRRVWDSGLKPNSITLISILPVCTKMGAVLQGKEIHGYATRSSLGTVVSVGNSLIDMYSKCGYLDLGAKVFDQMLEKNVVTYNTIIYAHGTHGQAQHAFSFFDEMKAANIRPNKVTFIGLLSACSHAGFVDRGRSLYSSMTEDYRFLPDMEHYSCMVDLFGRAGQLGDALNFVKMMPVEPDPSVLGSLLGACRAHDREELAVLVGTKVFQKRENDTGSLVLLSNIYASIDRWQDASKVRTVMKDEGLIKKPGKSWIQISGCVHTFHARGTTHPMLHKIHRALESLLLVMKNEGHFLDLHFFSRNLVGTDVEPMDA